MREWTIKDKTEHKRGILYRIDCKSKTIEILFTFHAIQRIKRWNLDENKIIETLLFPEEVLLGHYKRFIAHRQYEEHLLRAVYEYDNCIPVVITVYYPYKQRYFRGGGQYEDKIFRG